jgi:hypothetical protein
MTDTHGAAQSQHMAGMEDVAHQTVILAQAKLISVAGHDTGRILPAMLKDC